MGATTAGTILGTAAYMAPEQAKGKTADKRSDIWSFGAVVYELLSGKKPFDGESVVETLGAVINKEPDWRAVPERMRRLLQWCLEKDRKHRLQSIGDARRILEEIPVATPTARPSLRARAGWAAAAIFAVFTAMLAFLHFAQAPPTAVQPVRFQIYPPPKTTFAGAVDDPPAVSPDGKRLAFYAMGE